MAVDREARDRVRPVVERFRQGRTTTKEFRTELDEAVVALEPRGGYTDRFIWNLWLELDGVYDELVGASYVHEKSFPETLPLLDRCLLFLQSDLEYVWPDSMTRRGPFRFLLRVISKKYREREATERRALQEYWPFATPEQLDAERARQGEGEPG